MCDRASQIGPIAQNPGYHHFADERKMLGIPNFMNVITNVPFFLLGVAGLSQVRKFKEKQLRCIFITLFIGFFLLTFGSGYYHWSPNNMTLVYDRIPIAIVIMSFLSFFIYECVDKTAGFKAFFILNIIGALSVIYWIWTENVRKGDLRWYGLVQFFPGVAIPLILLIYKSTFNDLREILLLFVFFVLAKLAEMFDKPVYHLLNNIISGHSLKHLLLVGAQIQIVRMVENRVNYLEKEKTEN